jgi:hypothetical protein
MAIGSLLLAAPQMVLGFKQMKALSKVPRPNYEVSKELQASYDRAETMAQRGFTPEEEAAARATQSGAFAGQIRGGIARTGGSMAGALNVIAGSSQNDFNLGFASRSAGLRRQNIQYADQLMGKIDRVRMMRQELDIQRRQAQEDAAANLFNTGMANLEKGGNQMYDSAAKIVGTQLGAA